MYDNNNDYKIIVGYYIENAQQYAKQLNAYEKNNNDEFKTLTDVLVCLGITNVICDDVVKGFITIGNNTYIETSDKHVNKNFIEALVSNTQDNIKIGVTYYNLIDNKFYSNMECYKYIVYDISNENNITYWADETLRSVICTFLRDFCNPTITYESTIDELNEFLNEKYKMYVFPITALPLSEIINI